MNITDLSKVVQKTLDESAPAAVNVTPFTAIDHVKSHLKYYHANVAMAMIARGMGWEEDESDHLRKASSFHQQAHAIHKDQLSQGKTDTDFTELSKEAKTKVLSKLTDDY